MSYASIIPLVPSQTLWFSNGPVPTATSLAHRQGFMEKTVGTLGFEVSPLQSARDPALRAQHFYHNIKTLIREGGNVFPLFTRARNLAQKGYDNTVVVGLTWVDEVQVLLARKGSGLAGKPEGLKERRLGVSQSAADVDVWHAMALRGYDTALRLAGLSLDDVSLVPLRAPDLRFQTYEARGDNGSRVTEQALLSGEVDVIYARGAAAVLFQQQHGLDVVIDLNQLDNPQLRVNNGTPRVVTVHRHLLDDHPEVVTQYLRALQLAGQWAEHNPEAVVHGVAQDTATTPESVRQGYGPRLHRIFDVNLNATRVAALQDQADFLYRLGLIDVRVEVSDWIDSAPLIQSRSRPNSQVRDEDSEKLTSC